MSRPKHPVPLYRVELYDSTDPRPDGNAGYWSELYFTRDTPLVPEAFKSLVEGVANDPGMGPDEVVAKMECWGFREVSLEFMATSAVYLWVEEEDT